MRLRRNLWTLPLLAVLIGWMPGCTTFPQWLRPANLSRLNEQPDTGFNEGMLSIPNLPPQLPETTTQTTK